MYQFVDRPITALDPGGRVLVWSMRTWVRATARSACGAGALAPAYARWRMIGALQPFHRLMLRLNAHALETFAFCLPGCARISEHEAILLALVAEVSSGSPGRAGRTVAHLVDEDHAEPLMADLCCLVAALQVCSLAPGLRARGETHADRS